VSEPSLVGCFFALYRNGRLTGRGKVVDEFPGVRRMQRLNSKGEPRGIFDVWIEDVDDYVFVPSVWELDAITNADPSVNKLWKPLVPPGLAALNAVQEHENVCQIGREFESV
jgi:hypothetical protein